MAAPDTGQENATTIKLTQEDVEKIKSLPICSRPAYMTKKPDASIT